MGRALPGPAYRLQLSTAQLRGSLDAWLVPLKTPPQLHRQNDETYVLWLFSTQDRQLSRIGTDFFYIFFLSFIFI